MKLKPFYGINNRSPDTELVWGGDEPRVYVRDAVNGDFTGQGNWRMRCGVRRVSGEILTDLWQSPLDGTVLARRDDWLVKSDGTDWTVTPLVQIGSDELSYLVFNGAVLVAGARGLYRYAAGAVTRVQLDTPSAPWLEAMPGGLEPGQYGVALAWLSGSREGPLSALAFVTLDAPGSVRLTVPPCMDEAVTGFRVYMTPPDGAVLYHVADAKGDSVLLGADAVPGKQPPFQAMREMPTGRYLQAWGGRLMVARANALLFSQPLAYHIHDPKQDFVAMPQAVTFVVAVDGGLWVGQKDHVAFLQGSRPAELQLFARSASAPVPGSAVALKAGDLDGELGGSAQPTVAWLGSHGYVIGMADGSIVEVSASVLTGIQGNGGRTVAHGRRLLTIVH